MVVHIWSMRCVHKRTHEAVSHMFVVVCMAPQVCMGVSSTAACVLGCLFLAQMQQQQAHSSKFLSSPGHMRPCIICCICARFRLASLLTVCMCVRFALVCLLVCLCRALKVAPCVVASACCAESRSHEYVSNSFKKNKK